MKKKFCFAIFVLGFLISGPLEELLAVIGRPLTPLSVAGTTRRVARRTARRTTRRQTAMMAPATAVVATTAVIGSSVVALPAGSESLAIGGITYYRYNGVYYQPAYSGPNLVYTVVAPPL